MNIINCTPHTINVVSAGGHPVASYPASGQVARCATTSVPAGDVAGIPCVRTDYGAVVGLPAPQADTVYVVSGLVLDAATDRTDLVAPGELVRGPDGQPVGCKGFRVR